MTTHLTSIGRITGLIASLVIVAPQLAVAAETVVPSQWPNTAIARLEAFAALQSLNAELLSNASATFTLDRWCAAHKLAPDGSKILAQRVKGQDKPVDASIRKLLEVGSSESIAYRRVRLACGNRILSEADNWYVPSKLTPEMNDALNSTDVAFGRAVQALGFTRENLSAELLWSPLPKGWKMGVTLPKSDTEPLVLPAFLLQHHAVLKLPDGSPFSALVETYTASVLDFPAPQLDPR
jgi:hypothetical protein